MHEAAILLQALLDVRSNKISRPQAVSKVSEMLRAKATQSGHHIDDKFRNENGISLQLSHLEYALTNGETGFAPAYKWQLTIIQLFKEDHSTFKKLLKEANIVTKSANDIKSDFTKWLVGHKSTKESTKIKNSIITVDLLLRKNGAIRTSVLEIDDLDSIDKLVDRLRKRKIIHSKHLCAQALDYILAFKEYKNSSENSAQGVNSNSSDVKQMDSGENARATIVGSTTRKYYRDDKESFYQWLLNEKGLAMPTCRAYVSNIRSAEKYAQEHHFSHTKLYSTSLDEANATFEGLYKDTGFAIYDKEQHNRFRAAITKLIEYLGEEQNKAFECDAATAEEKTAPYIDTRPFRTALTEHFPNGFRLGSTIEIKKFRKYYEEQNGTPLDMESKQAECVIRNCGIEYENRLYIPEKMLSDKLRDKLFSYIKNRFENGATVVYFEALFREFSNEFLDYRIYDAEMLRSYIAYFNDDRYVIGRNYLSKEHLDDAGPIDEIRSCLKENVFPMQIGEISRTLPHIPKDRISSILSMNLEFARNSKGEYFHADSFDVSDEELDDIADLISAEIKQSGFMSGNELYDAIKTKYPYVYEKNTAFAPLGWRNALKYKLEDRFSFNGNVISTKGKALSMSDVFLNYGKNRQSFTLQEIQQFAEDVNSTIYFDDLYVNAARVSEEKFVRKDYVTFKVSETDNILDRSCPGSYVPLAEIRNFGIFPDASYPWNEYLLENYLAFHSQRYCLMHTGYNKYTVVGAMVKRSSGIKNFDELLIRVLAESGVDLEKQAALSYFSENGYIGSRSYSAIEFVMIRARELRNRKDK